jgi:prolyl-tRNA editing enzyme YbaK/EbsC (Cys-tRNA(Pro) deacylase)
VTGPGSRSEPASDADEIERRVRATLDGFGAPYEWLPIDPAYADTAAFCAHYGFPLECSGNTIVVASRKEPRQHAACLVLASTRLDVNHAVRRLMGVSRLSFATAEDTKAVTGMMIGGVTVLALPPGMPVYVDERVMRLDSVILGAGTRGAKVKVSPEALRRLPGLRVVAGLATE